MDMDPKDDYLDLKPLTLYQSETKWLCSSSKDTKNHDYN